MKNNLLIITAFFFLLVEGCQPHYTINKRMGNEYLKNYTPIDEKLVTEMVNQYKILKQKDTALLLQQISMDAIVLEKIAQAGDGIRLIFGAYPDNPKKTLVILDVYNLRSNSSVYYDMTPIFNDPLLRRTTRLPEGYLCPLPDGCPINLPEPKPTK